MFLVYVCLCLFMFLHQAVVIAIKFTAARFLQIMRQVTSFYESFILDCDKLPFQRFHILCTCDFSTLYERSNSNEALIFNSQGYPTRI